MCRWGDAVVEGSRVLTQSSPSALSVYELEERGVPQLVGRHGWPMNGAPQPYRRPQVLAGMAALAPIGHVTAFDIRGETGFGYSPFDVEKLGASKSCQFEFGRWNRSPVFRISPFAELDRRFELSGPLGHPCLPANAPMGDSFAGQPGGPWLAVQQGGGVQFYNKDTGNVADAYALRGGTKGQALWVGDYAYFVQNAATEEAFFSVVAVDPYLPGTLAARMDLNNLVPEHWAASQTAVWVLGRSSGVGAWELVGLTAQPGVQAGGRIALPVDFEPDTLVASEHRIYAIARSGRVMVFDENAEFLADSTMPDALEVGTMVASSAGLLFRSKQGRLWWWGHEQRDFVPHETGCTQIIPWDAQGRFIYARTSSLGELAWRPNTTLVEYEVVVGATTFELQPRRTMPIGSEIRGVLAGEEPWLLGARPVAARWPSSPDDEQ